MRFIKKGVDKSPSLCYYIIKKREDNKQKIEREDKTMMTNAEVMKKIEQLEQRKFIIWMTERWTREDRRMLDEIEVELKDLRAMVK